MTGPQSVTLKKALVKNELKAFKALLDGKGKGDLSESRDILPFFRTNLQLCGLMGRYNPNIVDDITVAHECDLFGDHVADLLIGDSVNRSYCFIEFENASATSIFKKGTKKTEEWSSRYEHGYSQLIDWILWLENNEGNSAFLTRFQSPTIEYNMLLVIGRSRDLSKPALRQRFDWRNNSVVVASKKVHCITFDKLYEDLNSRSKMLP